MALTFNKQSCVKNAGGRRWLTLLFGDAGRTGIVPFWEHWFSREIEAETGELCLHGFLKGLPQKGPKGLEDAACRIGLRGGGRLSDRLLSGRDHRLGRCPILRCANFDARAPGLEFERLQARPRAHIAALGNSLATALAVLAPLDVVGAFGMRLDMSADAHLSFNFPLASSTAGQSFQAPLTLIFLRRLTRDVVLRTSAAMTGFSLRRKIRAKNARRWTPKPSFGGHQAAKSSRTKEMVPKKGLEPPHPCEYMDLNHARLPIPPLRLGNLRARLNARLLERIANCGREDC